MNPCGNDLNELEAHIVRQQQGVSRWRSCLVGLLIAAWLVLFALFWYLKLRG